GASVRVLTAGDGDIYADATHRPRLPPNTALVTLLQEAHAPLDLSIDGPLRRLLPQGDREWLAANDVELATALRRRDGSIAAIVTLARKPGGFPYDRRDRWLVASLTTAAAAAAAMGDEDVARAGEAAFQCPQ